MSRRETTIEVLLAWILGLAVAGILYGPIIAWSQGAGPEGILRGLTMTPTHLALSYTIGAMISLPLVVTGLFAALLVGPRPGRRPTRWAMGTALVATILYMAGDALVRGDPLAGGGGLFLRPSEPVLLADAAIICMAVFSGALLYCRRVGIRASVPDRYHATKAAISRHQ